MNYSKQEVNKTIWKEAQSNELSLWRSSKDAEDWNSWWCSKFDNFNFIDKKLESILEVGCGPFAKNIQHLIQKTNQFPKFIGLNDPLLQQYIEMKKPVSEISDVAQKYSCPLEELATDEKYDCVICINVLDHVYNVEKCFNAISKALTNNGIIILGQDLKNEEDWERNPQDRHDILHPISFDYDHILKYLNCYSSLYSKILSRDEGRNPEHHYGTLLYAGVKK